MSAESRREESLPSLPSLTFIVTCYFPPGIDTTDMASKSMLVSKFSYQPVGRLFDCPPAFLAPVFAGSRGQCLASKFSTSSPSYTRKKRNNKERGVSPMRRTGLNMPLWRMSVGQEVKERGLPAPVDKDKRSKLVVDPEHGLWGFFNADKELLTSPVKSLQHGELRVPVWFLSEVERST